MLMEYKTVCSDNTCAGCMACVNICPMTAITIKDTISAYNAEIDVNKCVNCGLCEKVCPNINIRTLKAPIYWKQGWTETNVRNTSSSGGAASAIMNAFIIAGGYVASCLYVDGEFTFIVTNDLNKAKLFAGSKYVKSHPSAVYSKIKNLLKDGEKVLFVGLPCQSAAVQNYCDSDNLYTIDLICHGTPSPRLLKQYTEEKGFTWSDIKNIKFRNGNRYELSIDDAKITPYRVMDSYTLAFLKGIDYTENCYSCRYATIERVSDITLGDAWGQLSDVDPKGVSLIICQSNKGRELLQLAALHLEDVDLGKAIKANHQLQHPSIKHTGRTVFLRMLKKGKTVRYATSCALPRQSVKQSIKYCLIKMHIIHAG